METTTDGAKKRPTFLTVLCILTWIGCAIGLIGSVMGYFAAQTAGAMMGVAEGMAEGMTEAAGTDMSGIPGMEDAMASANAMVKHAMVILLVGVVGVLLCLVGSIQMWKLKKTGFYMYAIGEIVPPVVSMVLVGMGGFGALGIVGLIFPILFIVLYGLNLKHMS